MIHYRILVMTLLMICLTACGMNENISNESTEPNSTTGIENTFHTEKLKL